MICFLEIEDGLIHTYILTLMKIDFTRSLKITD